MCEDLCWVGWLVSLYFWGGALGVERACDMSRCCCDGWDGFACTLVERSGSAIVPCICMGLLARHIIQLINPSQRSEVRLEIVD